MHLPFGNMRAKQPVISSLDFEREELYEGQMVMAFERVPIVRGGHKPALAHAHHFLREAMLAPFAQNVFDDRIGENKIEAFIRKGQLAAVKEGVSGLWVMTARARDLAEIIAAGNDAFRVGIDILERVAKENVAARAYIQHAIAGKRTKPRPDKLELFRSRLVAELFEQPLENRV